MVPLVGGTELISQSRWVQSPYGVLPQDSQLVGSMDERYYGSFPSPSVVRVSMVKLTTALAVIGTYALIVIGKTQIIGFINLITAPFYR